MSHILCTCIQPHHVFGNRISLSYIMHTAGNKSLLNTRSSPPAYKSLCFFQHM